MPKKPLLQRHEYVLIILLLVSVLGVVYFFWQTSEQAKSIMVLTEELDQQEALRTAERATSTKLLAEASTTIAALSEELNLTAEELEDVEDDYKDEKRRNDKLNDQVDDLAETVGVLDKLAKTDEELLQKYSKVSFLNEHYVPEGIKDIDDEWKYDESRTHQLHSKVIPFFEDMVEEAKDDDIDLWVVSAYRSFDTQAQIKGQYTVIYGEGANTFSADQGFSEHQLGTTIDFTTSGIGGGLDGFGTTEAYEWLLDNAHKYGFVLSYPPNNAYYIFEPWHWRFVGVDLAKDLKRDDAYFYDWEQRDIDEYLISIFD